MKLLHWVAFLYGFYPNLKSALWFSEGFFIEVLSVTILETTKTDTNVVRISQLFYRSQFWRLQKLYQLFYFYNSSFIGHNFGDYKNHSILIAGWKKVLSVTILETTKTQDDFQKLKSKFYRSQFWRLQKQLICEKLRPLCFIGHNFGDYKNYSFHLLFLDFVLSVTILETTKTSNGIN